jgi:hypothetical protein
MSKFSEYFRSAILRKVGGKENEVQFAFAAAKRVAAKQQNARFQDEGEKALDRFGGKRVGHIYRERYLLALVPLTPALSLGEREKAFEFVN